jgi:hypothetical protein
VLFWRNILFIGINKNKNSINWNIYYIRKVEIIELLTGRIYIVDILPLEKSDYKSLTKSRYFFNWKEELEFELYKLTIKGHQDILGLISFEKYPEEWRIHVRLLTVSIENKGLNKMYDKIAGNLIAFVSKIAVKEYGELACISLRPKSTLAEYYIHKYNMRLTGATLSLEVPEIISLINKYDGNEQGK